MFQQPPKVTVKEEYLVYDAVAFVSSIGGTLGLCIAFSFYNSISVIKGWVEFGIRMLKRDNKIEKKPETHNVAVETVKSSKEMGQCLNDFGSKIFEEIARMKESIKREIKSDIVMELGNELKETQKQNQCVRKDSC